MPYGAGRFKRAVLRRRSLNPRVVDSSPKGATSVCPGQKRFWMSLRLFACPANPLVTPPRCGVRQSEGHVHPRSSPGSPIARGVERRGYPDLPSAALDPAEGKRERAHRPV